MITVLKEQTFVDISGNILMNYIKYKKIPTFLFSDKCLSENLIVRNVLKQNFKTSEFFKTIKIIIFGHYRYLVFLRGVVVADLYFDSVSRRPRLSRVLIKPNIYTNKQTKTK